MRKPKPTNAAQTKYGLAHTINAATRLLLQGANAEASSILRAAILRFPANASLLIRYGDALYQAGQIAQARDTYRSALALEHGEFQAWYGCGMAEFSLGAYGDAIECLRRALDLSANDIDAHLYLGKSLFNLGDADAAIDQLQFAAESGDAAARLMALHDIAIIIPGSPAHGNGPILKARRTWARLEAKGMKPSTTPARSSASGKIRLGYVSSFFGYRNWMKAIWGLINQHDRSEFEIHLFADRGMPSAESGYIKDARDFIHAMTDLSNVEAAQNVGEAEIDILVDLNGYSATERLGMFMSRPAPTLVSYFNLYATTGIRAFDYLIGDPVVLPAEEERFYTETILRTSVCYVAFSVTYPVPMVEPPPCLLAGYITFGCLAPQYKLTNSVIFAYAEILRAAPTARLFFKSITLRDPSNRRWLYERFDRCGIAQDRIDAEGPEEHFQFLHTYNRVDIALDTFPYNGGTTTMEALWQGVPVLTFNGDRWASRISSSILLAGGLREWVMPSLEMFIQRAIDLANAHHTPTMLSELRTTMRDQVSRSAACNTRMLCREMEQHYRTIHVARGRANCTD
jgi:protein O-GlcNAc transferase